MMSKLRNDFSRATHATFVEHAFLAIEILTNSGGCGAHAQNLYFWVITVSRKAFYIQW